MAAGVFGRAGTMGETTPLNPNYFCDQTIEKINSLDLENKTKPDTALILIN